MVHMRQPYYCLDEGLGTTMSFEVDDIVLKLLCFGANGVATFQGKKTSVIKQIASKYAPYCLGVRLIEKIWLSRHSHFFDIVAMIEELLQSTHAYLFHSPKSSLNLPNWWNSWTQEASLKMLKNVKT